MILLKWALCAALLSEIVLCPKLWVADRGFPTIPVVPGLPDLPQYWTVALAVILVSSLLATAVAARPRWFIAALLASGIVLVVFDVARLQPWFFQYFLMFLALSTMRWDDSESPRSRAAWAGCAFVVAGIYVWSGIEKANGSFATEVFPWLLHPLGPVIAAHLKPFWFVCPLGEASVGALLLVPRTRAYGLAGSATMHAINLLIIGPLGWNVNSTVWPWNFWVAAMAFILFLRTSAPVIRTAWPTLPGKLILLLIGVMPALNFVDCWDGFLSGSYYSGRLRDGWIYLTERGLRAMPEKYVTDNYALGRETPDLYRLDVIQWGLAKMNAPPYLEVRVYQAIVKKLIADGVPPQEITLYARDRKSLWDPVRSFSQVPIR